MRQLTGLTTSKYALLLHICIILCCFTGKVSAKPAVDIKLIYLFNIIKFVSWPADQEPNKTQLNLCIMGDSPFEKALSRLEGKTIRNLKIMLLYIKNNQQLPSCDVYYIDENSPHALPLDDTIKNLPILTVSEHPDFLNQGGIINFGASGNKIIFDINLVNARQAELSISSKLLELATQVIQ